MEAASTGIKLGVSGTLEFRDANGNLIYEPNKSLTISYNQFNLPREMDFGNNNRIHYHYNADGVKIYSGVFYSGGDSKRQHYCGLTVYESLNYAISSLKYINTPEGRIVNSGTNTAPVWSWEYAQ